MLDFHPVNPEALAWRRYCAMLVDSFDDPNVGANLFEATAETLKENNLHVFCDNDEIVAMSSVLQIGDVKVYTPNLWFSASTIKFILDYCIAHSPNCWFLFNTEFEPKLKNYELHEIEMQMEFRGYVQLPYVNSKRTTDEGFELEYPWLRNVWVPKGTDVCSIYEKYCFPRIDTDKLSYDMVDANTLAQLLNARPRTGIQRNIIFAGPHDMDVFCGFEYFRPVDVGPCGTSDTRYIVAYDKELVVGVMRLTDARNEIILNYIDVCCPYRQNGIATRMINEFNNHFAFAPFVIGAASETDIGRRCKLEEKIAKIVTVTDTKKEPAEEIIHMVCHWCKHEWDEPDNPFDTVECPKCGAILDF